MVEYIKAGKTELPVRVSYRVLRKLSSLATDDDYGQTERILHLAMENGAKTDNLPFTMSLDDVVDLIDAYPEVLGQFNAIMEKQVGELTGKMAPPPQSPIGG